MVIFDEQQLWRIPREFLDYYHSFSAMLRTATTARDNRLIDREDAPDLLLARIGRFDTVEDHKHIGAD
jgi:hypothetical protein